MTGYIKLVNIMGSDVDVVNAARASFDKSVSVLEDKDKRLIEYLIKNKHDSVLRHCTMTFEVYASLETKNQMIKHIVASTHLDESFGWNEVSRRYVAEQPTFFEPAAFRSKPDNSKQGSGGPVDEQTNKHAMELYRDFLEYSDSLYFRLMDLGVAPEQARLVLPYATMTRWRWTCSLQAALNFVQLRLGHGAQQEITYYAQEVQSILKEHFPVTLDAWTTYR